MDNRQTRNGEAKWEPSGGMLITQSRQKRLEADKAPAGKAEDQVRANIVYEEYQWSCYALHVDYALLKVVPGLWQVIAPYLAARFIEGDSQFAGSDYGKVTIRYNAAVDRLRQEYVHWRSSVNAVYNKFLKFLDGANVSRLTTESPQEFIRKHKEGAFVVFALLARARAHYQKMKGGEELGSIYPFKLVMPNGEEINVGPIIQAINEAVLAMPNHLSARVLTGAEAAAVEKVCAERLSGGSAKEAVDDLVGFCGRLSRPENRILTTTGQYIEKQVNTLTEADMVNEVVRELTGLETYTAYAKVLSWTEKMRTQALKTPPDLNPVTMPGWECRNLDGQFLFKKRSKVDAEISARQESWKPADPGEPVTTHAGGEQAKAPSPSSAAAGAGMGEPPPQFSGETESPPPPQRRESGRDREAPPHLEEQSEEEIAVVETKGVEPDEKEMKHKARNYRLVYKSDFYKSPGWLEECENNVKVFRKDGYYHILSMAPGYIGFAYPPVVVDNFLAQVDCEFVGRGEKRTECGMVFAVNKAGGFVSRCSIWITKGGFYCVSGESREKLRQILSPKKSEHIRQSDETNTLMAAKVGKEIAIWINGHDIASVRDDWFTSGSVGIFVTCPGGEPEGQVRFRNFEVYSIE